ncbi:type III restriction endonuclease, partial [Bacillus cereus]
LNALEEKDMGILCAGTGFGKTIVAAKLIADKKVSTLILVHNTNLAGQWKSQLEHFLKINDEPFVELTEKGRKKRKSKV